MAAASSPLAVARIAHGCDPGFAELARGHRPDTPEPFDRERVEEGELAVGRHHEQTVGLPDAARHLGEELRPGHAYRYAQTDALENMAAQPERDLGGCAREALQSANVEEGFVDRQPLDQRRRVFKHPK